MPAVARGIVRPRCEEEVPVEDASARPKTAGGREAAWSEAEARTVALEQQLAALRREAERERERRAAGHGRVHP